MAEPAEHNAAQTAVDQTPGWAAVDSERRCLIRWPA
jgi:hypothetical protein